MVGKLIQVRRKELFETDHPLPQPRLFGLEEVLWDGWLKATQLDCYAPRRSRQPENLPQTLFLSAEDI
jgi:hypothetical protein